MVLWKKIHRPKYEKTGKERMSPTKSELCFSENEDLFCLAHMKDYL